MRGETYTTPGPVALELRLPAGRLELETADTDQTRVELEPLRDDEESRTAVEAALIELRERAAGGQKVSVVVDEDSGRGLGIRLSRGSEKVLVVDAGKVRVGRHLRFGLSRHVEVLARVRCPHGTSLEAEVESADVEARGRFGSVSVSTGSGDVEIGEIEGDAAVNSASGDIELGRIAGTVRVNAASGDVAIGRAEGGGEISCASGDAVVDAAGASLAVKTASGDVVVRDAASSLAVKTASGDQRVDKVAEGEVTLESASGSIHVAVRRGTKLWVDVRSRTGETTSDLEVGDEPPAEGAPTLELRATSMSGDIHVGRAA
jgi:Putative adhesin